MISRLRKFACGAALAFPILLPTVAPALESSWAETANAKVRLLAGKPAPGSAGTVRAGIEIRLQRNWHTYWRYAGDAGIPPRFDWSGSENVEAVEVRWPAPSRIRVEDGIESIGYHDAVVLPLHIKPRDSAKPVRIALTLDFGVCEKICIPASARLALDIAPGSLAPSRVLDDADSRVPAKTAAGSTGRIAVLSGKLERGNAPHAVIDVAVTPGVAFDLFAEGPTDDWALPLPKLVENKGGRARFLVPIDGAPTGGGPMPAKLRLTLVAGPDAIETTMPLD